MQARMKNPVMIFPAAMQAMYALHASAEKSGVPARTCGLMELRASQINGCSVCVDMHARMLKKAGETDDRLFAVAAWRDAPYFTDAERAALSLTEAVTRLSDRDNPVPDEIWDEAARHYDEAGLSALLIAIATINVWNRLNVATRQVAGQIPAAVAQ
jgi:AhpD family alkylhydroperoxidase